MKIAGDRASGTPHPAACPDEWEKIRSTPPKRVGQPLRLVLTAEEVAVITNGNPPKIEITPFSKAC
jgi:hypothetical protein